MTQHNQTRNCITQIETRLFWGPFRIFQKTVILGTIKLRHVPSSLVAEVKYSSK